MRMALLVKNKLRFVNGTIKKPSSSPSTVAVWEHCNDMVLSWLLNSLVPEIANSVIYTDTTKTVWKDIEERFSQSNAPRIYQIKRAICTYVQDQSSLSIYFTKLKSLWDELTSYNNLPNCNYGVLKALIDHQQQERVFQFLMELNNSYSVIRSQILDMDPLPTVNKAYTMLL